MKCCIKKFAYISAETKFKYSGIEKKDKKIEIIPGNPETIIFFK